MGFLFHRGKNTTSRADMIADFQINTASYGEVVPEILGTTRVSGILSIMKISQLMSIKLLHAQAKAAAQSIQI